MSSPSPLSDVLAKLRERYVATSGTTIATFRQLADQLQRTPAAAEAVETLRRELHRVHGTAGSYGFHEASRLAGAFEAVALQWATDPALDAARRGEVVSQFARGLSGAFRSAPPADAPLARRLLLVGLEDSVALPCVTEGIHRGFLVERGMAGQLPQLLESGLPYAIVTGSASALPTPADVPLVLVKAGGEEPGQLLDRVEALGEHMGLAGATLVTKLGDTAIAELVREFAAGEGMSVVTLGVIEGLGATIARHRPVLMLVDSAMPQAAAGGDGGANEAEAPVVKLEKGVTAAELIRSVGRVLELQRQRRLRRGLHPATGLGLHDATTRAIGDGLRSSVGGVGSLALLRLPEPPAGRSQVAAWHRECVRVAAALGDGSRPCGFLDAATLLLLLPGHADAAATRVVALATSAEGEEARWCAGISEFRDAGEPSLPVLLRAAERGWLAARGGGERVRLAE